MLSSDFREKNEGRVKVEDADVDAFKALLNYMYTGKINLNEMTEERLADIFGLAHRYNVKDLVTAMCEHFCGSLTVKNTIGRLELADRFQLDDLEKAAVDFIDQNATAVLKDSALLSLSEVCLQSSSDFTLTVVFFKACLDFGLSIHPTLLKAQ